MRAPSEHVVVLAIVTSTCLSTIFCTIGLSTPGWHFDSYRSLFCDQCPRMSHLLAILSMVLLITCLIFLVLFLTGMIEQQQMTLMRSIIPILLMISTIILLITIMSYLSFVDAKHGYSYYLTVVAFVFAYFASSAAAFWLGTGVLISKSFTLDP
jgi:hypothetical protein